MAEARVERRLAAVFAADVAGYSRLMGADEVGTLSALKVVRRELVDPAIAAHKGRIVNTTGRAEETEAHIQEALRFSPRDPGAFGGCILSGSRKCTSTPTLMQLFGCVAA